ncbi:SLATT domain-containing protein [Rhizobium laguerreae]|uniref:SLATT domain-containing protein n=1 Tax=Rhizobium laguerreae TaxID=1076926 RepID=UPI001C9065FF|nr:SLATT domain-containing protein [Rhizobium laguerreae]MBY3151934.1 SLATT domain-containing protein [Rhizobium laguerreae]
MSAEKLLKDMHQTKGARFAAHQRLTRLHDMSGYTISIISFFVICISVFLVMFQQEYSPLYGKYLTFISVAISVLIIILSLQDGSKNNLLRAEMMHNCAREVLAVYRELSNVKDPTDKDIQEYSRRYQGIIDRYPYNHEPLDRELYLYDQYLKNKRDGRPVEEVESPRKEYLWSIYGMNLVYIFSPAVLSLVPVVIYYLSRMAIC